MTWGNLIDEMGEYENLLSQYREEIIAANRLIAVFMGFKENRRMKDRYVSISDVLFFPDGGKGCFAECMKYDKSWDWIITVIEKIETLGVSISFASVGDIVRGRSARSLKIYEGKTNNDPIVSIGYTSQPMHTVFFNAAVEFIKWYESQLKNSPQ